MNEIWRLSASSEVETMTVVATSLAALICLSTPVPDAAKSDEDSSALMPWHFLASPEDNNQ